MNFVKASFDAAKNVTRNHRYATAGQAGLIGVALLAGSFASVMYGAVGLSATGPIIGKGEEVSYPGHLATDTI